MDPAGPTSGWRSGWRRGLESPQRQRFAGGTKAEAVEKGPGKDRTGLQPGGTAGPNGDVTASRAVRPSVRGRDGSALLGLELVRPLAQGVGLGQVLLLGGAARLLRGAEREQHRLVGDRLVVVGIDLEGAVLGLHAGLNVGDGLLTRHAGVAVDLVVVERTHRVPRFGVVRLEVGALLERLHRLVEIALAVVEVGQQLVAERRIGSDL